MERTDLTVEQPIPEDPVQDLDHEEQFDEEEADKISILNNNLNIITADRTALLSQQR